MAVDFLPYGRHQIEEDDIEAVVNVLRHGALTCGPKVQEFERAFAAKVGAAEAVVCSNGTTALHLAVLAADIGPGDTVIVPAITFLATANAVRMAGGDVVFADVCPDTGLMTSETLKEAMESASGPVKAIMPVHLNGQCVDMSAIKPVAESYGCTVITDCCHALGARYQLGGCPGDGHYEDLACFSLHPVKSIAMGEGGVVTTNDSALAEKMRRLRGHDMRRERGLLINEQQALDVSGEVNPWYYEMHELGYNYRATDMQCALGLSQLGKLDRFVARRAQIADLYDTEFAHFSNHLRPVPRTHLALSAWHLYAVHIDFNAVGLTRAQVMRQLAERGVGTQVHYLPVAWQPYYVDLYGKKELPGAEAYYAGVLSLPIFPMMEDKDVATVVAALRDVLG